MFLYRIFALDAFLSVPDRSIFTLDASTELADTFIPFALNVVLLTTIQLFSCFRTPMFIIMTLRGLSPAVLHPNLSLAPFSLAHFCLVEYLCPTLICT